MRDIQRRPRGLWWERPGVILESHSPFVFVFVPLAILYVVTASLTTHEHIDPLTNSLTAWHLGMTGSVVLPDHAAAASPEYRGNVAWIVDGPQGPVSQYPPGAAILAAPAYALAGRPLTTTVVEGLNRPTVEPIVFPLPDPLPASITAALASAAAMGFIAAAIPFAGGSKLASVAVGYVGGLCTTFWATASDSLWQHGPASMWVALGVLLAARSNHIWSGFAFGAAVITRPHLAVVAVSVAIYMGLRRRSFRPVFAIGLGSSVGLIALLGFNWWVTGEATIAGGYGMQAVNGLASPDISAYVGNILGGLFDPTHGLLPYSPWILVLIPGISAGWKALPDWGRGAAIGGLTYLLIQWKANRFSGGDGFLGYRYPLETLTTLGILFYLSYSRWARRQPAALRLFWGAAVISLVPQVLWQLGMLPGSQ